MNATLSRLSLVVGMVVASGCQSIELSELTGSYVAEYSFGSETLRLKRDGTFTQSFVIHERDAITNDGRWDYKLGGNGFAEVWLIDCLMLDDGFGRLREQPVRGRCVEPVERTFFLFGKPRLGVSDMHPYVKKE